jgi:hypothetical protein
MLSDVDQSNNIALFILSFLRIPLIDEIFYQNERFDRENVRYFAQD